jgi:hypothetical protein
MEDEIERRFNQLEKRVSDGFVRMETLIETLANTCARQFESIDDRFDTLESKFDSLARRMDDEVEQRHVLGERITKLERS